MSNAQPVILITGGTGFAGSHLVEHLVDQGYTNIHVTAFSSGPTYVDQFLSPDHIHRVNLNDAEQTTALIQTLKPDHIYHLAAFAAVGESFQKIQEVLENNMILQLNVLNAVKEHSPHARTLVIGSAMEYDFTHITGETISETAPLGPISPYAVSKVLQDLLGYSYAQSYTLDIVRVRPFNHIGERQSPDFAIPAFAKQIVAIERGEQTELSVGNLDAVRDFTDVKDMVAAYHLLMEKGVSPEVYNVGTGRGYTMSKILAMLIELAETEIPVVTDPQKLRPADIPRTVADISKIKQLGWKPTIALRDTLQRTVEYWRAQ